jgi:hypothetical protein
MLFYVFSFLSSRRSSLSGRYCLYGLDVTALSLANYLLLLFPCIGSFYPLSGRS